MKWLTCILLYFLGISVHASSFERANTLFPRVNDLQIRARNLLSIGQRPLPKVSHGTTLTAVILSGNSWEYEQVEDRLLNTAAVYLQCGVHVEKIDIYFGSAWEIDGIAGIWNSSNKISHPYRSNQVKRLGELMIEEGITSRPALIYIEEQQYSGFGASFPLTQKPTLQ